MPTYEYLCETCSHRFEAWQKMSDEPLQVCPECGRHIRRVFYPAGIVFKGSGFYKTDHGNGAVPEGKKSENGNGSESNGSNGKDGNNGNSASKPASESKASEGSSSNASSSGSSSSSSDGKVAASTNS